MTYFKQAGAAKEIEPAGTMVQREDGVIVVHDGITKGGVKLLSLKEQFVEELIQLQIKYGILLEGYDVSLWGPDDAYTASNEHNDPSYLVTEKKIRDRWRHLKGE